MKSAVVKNKKPRFARVDTVSNLQNLLESTPRVALHYFYGKNDKSPLRDPEVRQLLDNRNVVCVEVDVATMPEIPAKMGVKAYPVTLFYNNGKMVITHQGALHLTGWARFVDKAFSS